MIGGLGQPTSGYTPVARALHWTTAALVIFMILAGFYIANVEDGPFGDEIYDLHKSVGILILPLILVRLLYRLTHKPPPLPADMPFIEQLAAHANHWGLYVMLIAQPIVGWIATSAYRAPIPFFWLFNIPPIWREDRAFSDRPYVVHGWIGIAITVFVLGHIAAALFHHFIRKDDILVRMWRG
jgi:cytochrome b561